ncbi:Uncharacterized protein HZ326_9650, partial [Fusarium oxysporum f. sp. albedinis]
MIVANNYLPAQRSMTTYRRLFLTYMRSSSHHVSLSRESQQMLSYYDAITAPMLAAMPSQNTNPFLKLIMPLACADESVMLAVSGLGGAHLCHADSVVIGWKLFTFKNALLRFSSSVRRTFIHSTQRGLVRCVSTQRGLVRCV